MRENACLGCGMCETCSHKCALYYGEDCGTNWSPNWFADEFLTINWSADEFLTINWSADELKLVRGRVNSSADELSFSLTVTQYKF